MNKPTPARVRVDGPLEPYRHGFGLELASRGYASSPAAGHLQLMGHLSRWLDQHGLEPGELAAARVEQFLEDRRAAGRVHRALTLGGVSPLLDYLRTLGVVPAPQPPVQVDPLEMLVVEFAAYLVNERGLAKPTVANYRSVATAFLSACSQESSRDGLAVGGLAAEDVTGFVLAQAQRRLPGSLNNVATGLRALLGFLYVEGHTATSLDTAVPTAPGWRDSGIPRAAGPDQVSGLLASCDRRTSSGRRDFAILMLLARLGLRAAEVAALNVEDIDWRAGVLVVTGKGNRREQLPLPQDVGQAIAEYCQHGRRRGDCRRLFLRGSAPYNGLSSSGIRQVVARGCARAGLETHGHPPVAARCRHRDASLGRAAVRDRSGAAASARGQHRALRQGRPRRHGPRGPRVGRGPGVIPLRQRVEDYLTLRRALGYKLEAHGPLLADFVEDLEQAGTSTITNAAALAWAMKPQRVQPYRWKQRLTVIRGFARYLSALDADTQVPPSDLLAYRRQRPTPYLFSEEEITGLMVAAGELAHPLRAASHRTLFGLLAATGMRDGEALRLDRDDVDLHGGTLDITKTKFNKSRRLPLHTSTVSALADYARVRDRWVPAPAQPSFFISTTGSRLAARRVRAVFAELVDQLGLGPRAGSGRPTMHSLRHGFAVTTLLEWYRSGVDVAVRMPLLSAYLGHASPTSTYWYLQAVPELLVVAAGRLETHTGGQR